MHIENSKHSDWPILHANSKNSQIYRFVIKLKLGSLSLINCLMLCLSDLQTISLLSDSMWKPPDIVHLKTACCSNHFMPRECAVIRNVTLYCQLINTHLWYRRPLFQQKISIKKMNQFPSQTTLLKISSKKWNSESSTHTLIASHSS